MTIDTDELVRELPLDQLHDSPFQPRKTYTGLHELAENIKAEKRIHQPLVVRCKMVNPTAAQPEDMFAPGYEIVFGHRRKRGAELAGLATVPCVIRAMTDAEVRSAQMAENLQRENMLALEEAAGYQAQMEEDGLSAAALAERLGKSKSHVLGRVLLLGLVPEAKQLLELGQMGSETALLIARLRHPKLQEKALARVKSKWGGNGNLLDGGKGSFRAVRELFADEFTLRLKEAIFDPEDAELLPSAGVCSTCPKRSGNAPEWEDIAQLDHQWRQCGPDLCTDPDCFAVKKATHLAREAAKLEEAGKTVVTGSKAKAALDQFGKVKPGAAFIELKEVQSLIKSLPKGAAQVPVVQIQDQRTGKTVRAVAKAALAEAGVELEKVEPKPAQGHGQRDWERERREREEKAEAETAARRNLLAAVFATAANRPVRVVEELRIVARHLVAAAIDFEQEVVVARLFGFKAVEERLGTHEFRASIESMDGLQLALVLMGVAITHKVEVGGYEVDEQPEPLLALAELYGVDIEAARAGTLAVAAEPASTPSTAARAAKKAKGAPAGADKATAGGAARAGGKGAKKKTSQTDEAPAAAGAEVKDDAGGAGERGEGGGDE